MNSYFDEKWKAYKRRNRAATFGLILGLPAAFAVAVVLKRALPDVQPDVLLGAVVGLWCVCWGWLAFRVARFPCPRCGEVFFANQEPLIVGPRSCGNCGLQLYGAS